MFIRHLKFAFLPIALFVILTPSFSYAIDQRCWTKAACEKWDANNVPGLFYGPNSETVKACKMDEDLVTRDKVGFCSAAGYAKTEIEFGAGNNQFANFGKFIEWFYQYAIIVASILAIFMIIFSGFQWATSGGSPEKITEARKKIGGAMMGLFLAVLAYFILNIVNPYLVHLRLPQVWRINTSGLTPPYCDQLKDRKVSETEGGPFNLDPVKDPLHASFCGKEYFVQGSALTCLGRSCDGSVCMDSGEVDAKSNPVYQCYLGVLGGKLGAPNAWFCSDLSSSIIDSSLELIAMCNDGDIEKVDDVDSGSLSSGARQYTFGNKYPFTVRKKVKEVCLTKHGVAGFFLGADVNDEGGGFFGKKCPGNPVSIGADDWFAIGKNGAGACSVNLAKVAYGVLNGGSEPSCKGDDGIANCSCASVTDEPVVIKLAKNEEFLKYLITQDELLMGFPCDIFIDRDEFPALDNANTPSAIFCNIGADPTACWCSQDYY